MKKSTNVLLAGLTFALALSLSSSAPWTRSRRLHAALKEEAMRALLVCLAAVFAACSDPTSGRTTTNMSSSDEQAIFRETEGFAAAWNKGDAKEAASFYTDDAVRVGAFGDVQHGQAEIEAAYDRLLRTTMPGAKVSQERGSLRMLSPELAVWQAGIEIIPAGTGSSLKGHVVQVMKKVNGRWLILEAHPKIFPPGPAPS